MSCVPFSHKNSNATNCDQSQTKTKGLTCLVTEMWAGAKVTTCFENVGKDLSGLDDALTICEHWIVRRYVGDEQFIKSHDYSIYIQR